MPLSPVSSGCCLDPGRISARSQTHHLALDLNESQTPHLQRQLKILRLIHPKERDPRAIPVKAGTEGWGRKPIPARAWYVVGMRNLCLALAVRMMGAGASSTIRNTRRFSFG